MIDAARLGSKVSAAVQALEEAVSLAKQTRYDEARAYCKVAKQWAQSMASQILAAERRNMKRGGNEPRDVCVCPKCRR